MNARFWTLTALVISLAFNIAVIMMHFFGPPPHMPHGPEAFEERITHQMDKADADIVHAAFIQHAGEFASHRRDMDEAIGGVRKVLETEPLNQDNLKVAMDKARATRALSEQTMEQTMLDAAKELSPEGRLKLVPPPPPAGSH